MDPDSVCPQVIGTVQWEEEKETWEQTYGTDFFLLLNQNEFLELETYHKY